LPSGETQIPKTLELPFNRRMFEVVSDAVSITVISAATSYESAASFGNRLQTNKLAPSLLMAAAIGSRIAGTRWISLPPARSITETLLLNRLLTYNREPSGDRTGAPGVCPTAICPVTSPVAASAMQHHTGRPFAGDVQFGAIATDGQTRRRGWAVDAPHDLARLHIYRIDAPAVILDNIQRRLIRRDDNVDRPQILAGLGSRKRGDTGHSQQQACGDDPKTQEQTAATHAKSPCNSVKSDWLMGSSNWQENRRVRPWTATPPLKTNRYHKRLFCCCRVDGKKIGDKF
jgi:hypothetical protein